MLGLLKPYKLELLVKDVLYYKLYYCSVCRHLSLRHSRLYAFLNSYEGALLAMLYNEMVVRDVTAFKDRCTGIPLVKVGILPPDNEAITLGACISLLAFQIKFKDDLLDEAGWWAQRYNRLLLGRVEKSFAGGGLARFNIDPEHIRAAQEKLHRLEKDEAKRDLGIFLQCWSELFAYIMTQPFQNKIAAERQAALKTFFAGLGKIIYLLDAMDDIHRDRDTGRFNLVLRCEPGAGADDETWLLASFAKYRQIAAGEQAALWELLPHLQLRESLPIVQNILTHCLDKEAEKVFESMVLKKVKKENLFFNCKDF